MQEVSTSNPGHVKSLAYRAQAFIFILFSGKSYSMAARVMRDMWGVTEQKKNYCHNVGNNLATNTRNDDN